MPLKAENSVSTTWKILTKRMSPILEHGKSKRDKKKIQKAYQVHQILFLDKTTVFFIYNCFVFGVGGVMFDRQG